VLQTALLERVTLQETTQAPHFVLKSVFKRNASKFAASIHIGWQMLGVELRAFFAKVPAMRRFLRQKNQLNKTTNSVTAS
jgi:hypothetical protein